MSKCPAYCPPTCKFTINYCDYPIYCEDYDCTNPETCTNYISSDCVVYEGTLLQQYGVDNGATATEIIQQLVNLIYPGCVPTTTTTTECQRPTGLSQFNFNDTIICSGVPTQFSGSEILACQALYDYTNTPGCNQTQGFVVEASQLIVGETVYSFGGTDCSYPEDGYYLYTAISNSIIHLVDGVIQSVSDCTTTTTTTAGP